MIATDELAQKQTQSASIDARIAQTRADLVKLRETLASYIEDKATLDADIHRIQDGEAERRQAELRVHSRSALVNGKKADQAFRTAAKYSARCMEARERIATYTDCHHYNFAQLVPSYAVVAAAAAAGLTKLLRLDAPAEVTLEDQVRGMCGQWLEEDE